jgi:hypothetical protein
VLTFNYNFKKDKLNRQIFYKTFDNNLVISRLALFILAELTAKNVWFLLRNVLKIVIFSSQTVLLKVNKIVCLRKAW